MRTSVVTSEDFDELLLWLDPEFERTGVADRDRGALKYEVIRRRIVKIYQNRGSHQAEEIADETFNRVCLKMKKLRKTYHGDPSIYFFAVAKNVYREFMRDGGTTTPIQPSLRGDPEEIEVRMQCLDLCLGRLDPSERNMILKFYEGEKGVKIENRKRLAADLGINTKALSLRAMRVRRELLDCMRACLEKHDLGK